MNPYQLRLRLRSSGRSVSALFNKAIAAKYRAVHARHKRNLGFLSACGAGYLGKLPVIAAFRLLFFAASGAALWGSKALIGKERLFCSREREIGTAIGALKLLILKICHVNK